MRQGGFATIYEVMGGKVKFLLFLFFLSVSILIRIMTQSIGLLSYTYLTQTQLDEIVVPMVSGISHILLIKGFSLYGGVILNATALLHVGLIRKEK